MVFNVVPTIFELAMVSTILGWKCGAAFAGNLFVDHSFYKNIFAPLLEKIHHQTKKDTSKQNHVPAKYICTIFIRDFYLAVGGMVK